MDLAGTKSLVTSKTFWGVIIAAISPVLQIFGVNVGTLLSDTMQHVVELVGLVMALYGRIKARQTIGSLV